MSRIEIGSRIRRLRTLNGMTQKEFAKMVGISQGTLSDIESAKTLPSVETIISIVRSVDGVSCDDLLLNRRSLPGEEFFFTAGKESLLRDFCGVLKNGDADVVKALKSTLALLLKVCR